MVEKYNIHEEKNKTSWSVEIHSATHAAMEMAGVGEPAMLDGNGVKSPSPRWLWLFSLGAALPVRLTLSVSPLTLGLALGLTLALASAPSSSVPDSVLGGLGARQVGTSQTTPVKLLSWKGLRSQRRQGAPLRSRARSPALIAPWLALGPSRDEPDGLLASGAPSSLKPR